MIPVRASLFKNRTFHAIRKNTTQRCTHKTQNTRPTLLATPPDLLDPVTYREEDATAFFQRVEDAMKTAPNAAETFPVRYVCVCVTITSLVGVCQFRSHPPIHSHAHPSNHPPVIHRSTHQHMCLIHTGRQLVT